MTRVSDGDHDVDNTPIENSGHISQDSLELLAYDSGTRWVTAEEYLPGDVVIITMKTLHGSIHNTTVCRPRNRRLSNPYC